MVVLVWSPSIIILSGYKQLEQFQVNTPIMCHRTINTQAQMLDTLNNEAILAYAARAQRILEHHLPGLANRVMARIARKHGLVPIATSVRKEWTKIIYESKDLGTVVCWTHRPDAIYTSIVFLNLGFEKL
jgi:hypothetical protein